MTSPKLSRITASLHGTFHSATVSPCSSRPLSRATSLCDASSGYESTRSHLGPHYSYHNMPRNNSPELKYNTLKPRRKKQQQQQQLNNKQTQFYSLRICRKHDNKKRKNYQLYAIPIVKKCQHNNTNTSASTSTVNTDMQELSCDVDESLDTIEPIETTTTEIETETTTENNKTSIENELMIPPIPAPRTIKTDPSKHTYQNIPPPIYPTKPRLKLALH